MTRWPTATCWRGAPTRPRQAEAASCESSWLAPPAPAATESRVAERASAPSTPSCGASRRRRRIRIDPKITSEGDLLDIPARRGDHGRVVGAELERCEGGAGQRRAELRVRGDASDDGDLLGSGLLRGGGRPFDECADDRPLVRSSEIGAPPLDLLVAELSHLVEERGLEAREREVEARHASDWELEGLGVTLLRQAVDLGSTGIAEAEQPGALVERLAGRVVERRAQNLETGVILDVEQERVAAAREQAEERAGSDRAIGPKNRDAT